MAKKSTATEPERYFLYKNGKKREVTKEEFEKHFPPVTEEENADDSKRASESNT